ICKIIEAHGRRRRTAVAILAARALSIFSRLMRAASARAVATAQCGRAIRGFLIGNRRHGINDLFRWIVAQQAFEAGRGSSLRSRKASSATPDFDSGITRVDHVQKLGPNGGGYRWPNFKSASTTARPTSG